MRPPARSYPPIYQTSTYKQDGVGGLRGGYEYSRSANPTRTALEECLAALEGGRRGLAFASGLAAEDTVLRALCVPGDHVVIPGDAYGGTYRLFDKVAGAVGARLHPGRRPRRRRVRAQRSARASRRSCGSRRRPTRCSASSTSRRSPQLAHDAGALLVVDNTFASPYLTAADRARRRRRRALDDEVHGRSLRRRRRCGRRSPTTTLAEQVAFHQNAIGAVAGPFDSWLVLRGIKTLGVRMDRHCDNAERIVDVLTAHPTVDAGALPGAARPPRPRDRRQADEVASAAWCPSGSPVARTQAVEICNRTELFTLGESLGGVESLIEHPGRMTHASVAGSPLEVPADLVRLSVGIETVDDLVDDLARRPLRWLTRAR